MSEVEDGTARLVAADDGASVETVEPTPSPLSVSPSAGEYSLEVRGVSVSGHGDDSSTVVARIGVC